MALPNRRREDALSDMSRNRICCASLYQCPTDPLAAVSILTGVCPSRSASDSKVPCPATALDHPARRPPPVIPSGIIEHAVKFGAMEAFQSLSCQIDVPRIAANRVILRYALHLVNAPRDLLALVRRNGPEAPWTHRDQSLWPAAEMVAEPSVMNEPWILPQLSRLVPRRSLLQPAETFPAQTH